MALMAKLFTVMDNSFNFANAIRVCQICYLESESENEEVDDEEPAFIDVIEGLSTTSGDDSFNPLHNTAIEQMDVRHRQLMVNTSTRCNTLYEALSRMITIPTNKLNPLCVKLGNKCLIEMEHLLLQEYCPTMKPLTGTLDVLQGEEGTYGPLLPALTKQM